MSKYFIFLFIVLSFYFVSCSPECSGENTENKGVIASSCDVYEDCKSDEDCDEGWYCAAGGECHRRICFVEKVNCGLGKCIDDLGGGYHCECDEGAKFYVDVCVLNCDNNATCEEFSKTDKTWKAFGYCDIEKGHCVDYVPDN